MQRRTLAGLGALALVARVVYAAAFMRGKGQVLTFQRNLKVGDAEVPVFTLPGIGPVTASCTMGVKFPIGNFQFSNQSGAPIEVSLQYPEGGTDGGVLQPGKSTEVGGFEFEGAWTFLLATDSSPTRFATLNLGFTANGTPTACAMLAQATIETG